MYQRITAEDPYQVPMRIYPAVHYTMGGLWVDYNLESTIPGLFVLGEANFSDHGANRLGASALMQGLADGYFVAALHASAATWPGARSRKVSGEHPAFARRPRPTCARALTALLEVGGRRTVDQFHRELGHLMWDHCGMARNAAGLERARAEIRALRAEF